MRCPPELHATQQYPSSHGCTPGAPPSLRAWEKQSRTPKRGLQGSGCTERAVALPGVGTPTKMSAAELPGSQGHTSSKEPRTLYAAAGRPSRSGVLRWPSQEPSGSLMLGSKEERASVDPRCVFWSGWALSLPLPTPYSQGLAVSCEGGIRLHGHLLRPSSQRWRNAMIIAAVKRPTQKTCV